MPEVLAMNVLQYVSVVKIANNDNDVENGGNSVANAVNGRGENAGNGGGEANEESGGGASQTQRQRSSSTGINNDNEHGEKSGGNENYAGSFFALAAIVTRVAS